MKEKFSKAGVTAKEWIAGSRRSAVGDVRAVIAHRYAEEVGVCAASKRKRKPDRHIPCR